jgi:hypothetical protein
LEKKGCGHEGCTNHRGQNFGQNAWIINNQKTLIVSIHWKKYRRPLMCFI